MAFSATSLWWILIPLVIGATAISWYGSRKYISKFKIKPEELDVSLTNIIYLALATIFQVAIVMLINLVELHYVNPHINLRQITIYTGVENLAVFVALTPGAIGIREGFLIFSRKLHHITVANIIAASIIDRAVFIVVLILLLVYVVSSHAKTKLFKAKQNKETPLK